MVSVVHAEDSSSANVNSSVSIFKIEGTSVGILKIYLTDGPSFFVRSEYLVSFPVALLHSGSIVPETEVWKLVLAGKIYLAERCAMEYLGRAEHSRYSVSAKLLKKGYTVDEISPALDFLQNAGCLDDIRFASAWLRSRTIHQSEGRQKLLSGLLSRGISGSDAKQALDDFFEFADEKLLCIKALEKFQRIGKTKEKLTVSLIRKGFSVKLINECVKIVYKE